MRWIHKGHGDQSMSLACEIVHHVLVTKPPDDLYLELLSGSPRIERRHIALYGSYCTADACEQDCCVTARQDVVAADGHSYQTDVPNMTNDELVDGGGLGHLRIVVGIGSRIGN